MSELYSELCAIDSERDTVVVLKAKVERKAAERAVSYLHRLGVPAFAVPTFSKGGEAN